MPDSRCQLEASNLRSIEVQSRVRAFENFGVDQPLYQELSDELPSFLVCFVYLELLLCTDLYLLPMTCKTHSILCTSI